MVVNIVLQKLIEIGFTEYEAKAYVALLGDYPATAYEVAKASGIPTSKIYQVMDRLSEKGLAIVAEEGPKKRFAPMEPEEFLSARKERLQTLVADLSTELAAVKTAGSAAYVWNVQDYRRFIEKARRSIFESKETILISLWPEEAGVLSAMLAEAVQRGVKCAAVQFGEGALNLDTSFHHPIEDTLYAEKGGRSFVLVTDGEEALMGTIHTDGEVAGTWSRSRGFVTLAEDYVKHDIYIMKIVARFDEELVARFGPKYEMLRDVYSDREVAR